MGRDRRSHEGESRARHADGTRDTGHRRGQLHAVTPARSRGTYAVAALRRNTRKVRARDIVTRSRCGRYERDNARRTTGFGTARISSPRPVPARRRHPTRARPNAERRLLPPPPPRRAPSSRDPRHPRAVVRLPEITRESSRRRRRRG